MGHSDNHGHSQNKKSLMIAFVVTTGFMIAEIIGGFVTNSLALLSDAGHMLSDAVYLALSLLAFKRTISCRTCYDSNRSRMGIYS